MLRRQCEHSVVHWSGTDLLGSGLRSVLHGACGACKPFLANAPEGSVRLADTCSSIGARPASTRRQARGVVTGESGEVLRTHASKGQAVVCAVATVEAGVRLAAVNVDLAVVSRKSRGTHAGRVGGGAINGQTCASILTRRSVCQTQASLQMAVITSVSMGTDAEVSPLSRIDAGGVARTRPG